MYIQRTRGDDRCKYPDRHVGRSRPENCLAKVIPFRQIQEIGRVACDGGGEGCSRVSCEERNGKFRATFEL